jgi:O-antigen ligase
MIVTVILSLDLLLKYRVVEVPLYFIVFGFYVFFKIVLIGPTHNLGLQLQSISLPISALIAGTWIYNRKISPTLIYIAVLPAILVSIVASLSMYFYRLPLFGSYSPWGAPIGLKNSLSVYLTQTLPILFLALSTLKNSKGKAFRCLEYSLILVATTCCWIIIANRTRSAWWMLIFFLLILIWKVRKLPEGTYFYKVFILISLLGTFLTFSVPNQLRWNSDTPYTDSLSTMISPKKSSGRLELWKVASTIFIEHPFLGIGTGNYPILWQEYIPKSEVNPRKFRFLRPDLNLFNDYFQALVENGVLNFALSLIIFLIFPIYLIGRHNNSISSYLQITVCIITGIDAFFDYPFNRPESILIFICMISLALKELGSPIILNKILLKVILASSILFSSILGIKLGGAVYHRSAFAKSQNVNDLKYAWSYWPWDFQWNSYVINYLITNGELSFAEDIATKRKFYWPNDKESQIMINLTNEHKNK